ncbi:F-box only protein 36-like isoform X2 [Tubulanus polymorphus]|uniref:F-box only protein 36-like isoform X2 n=1 Tax=Tubulanus polymorphus TaxID=672921 RepID=UPI003DA4EC11
MAAPGDRRQSVIDAVKHLGLDRKQSIIPTEKGIIFEYSDVAPSPSRDFCQIIVSKEEVVFRWWKISSRNDARVAPGQVRETHEEFLDDDRTQSEIHRVFGKGMVDYVKNLCNGKIDYIARLPHKVLIHMLLHLDLEDISRLAQTCKQFRKLCNSDDLWERIYRTNSETPITAELTSLAEEQGWKKLFFTNKLQLQVQLRRKKSDH